MIGYHKTRNCGEEITILADGRPPTKESCFKEYKTKYGNRLNCPEIGSSKDRGGHVVIAARTTTPVVPARPATHPKLTPKLIGLPPAYNRYTACWLGDSLLEFIIAAKILFRFCSYDTGAYTDSV